MVLDYWHNVNPSERNFWRHLRESMQKLDIAVGCLLANSDEVAWASQCAEEGLPVVALETVGTISIQKGIEGAEAAAMTQTDPRSKTWNRRRTGSTVKPKQKLSYRREQLSFVSIFMRKGQVLPTLELPPRP